jgi:hypothetical protein
LFAGQGLGRHSQGMVDALKPKLKFDQAGIGKKFIHFFVAITLESEVYNVLALNSQKFIFSFVA